MLFTIILIKYQFIKIEILNFNRLSKIKVENLILKLNKDISIQYMYKDLDISYGFNSKNFNINYRYKIKIFNIESISKISTGSYTNLSNKIKYNIYILSLIYKLDIYPLIKGDFKLKFRNKKIYCFKINFNSGEISYKHSLKNLELTTYISKSNLRFRLKINIDIC